MELLKPEEFVCSQYFEKNGDQVNKEVLFEIMEAYANHVKACLCSNAVQKIQEIWK